jgi:hypothetical protein
LYYSNASYIETVLLTITSLLATLSAFHFNPSTRSTNEETTADTTVAGSIGSNINSTIQFTVSKLLLLLPLLLSVFTTSAAATSTYLPAVITSNISNGVVIRSFLVLANLLIKLASTAPSTATSA